jgi:lipoate-protein ligase A
VFRSTGPPSHDLAFEAEMLDRAADGTSSVLVASWPEPVVVLGYAQAADDVDLEWCRRRGIPVLRRLSGGTAVVHHGDLGVSLALPSDHSWSGEIVGLYERFLGAIEPALVGLGSEVERLRDPPRATLVRSPICFEDQLADTLVIDDRKVVGCSQVRRKRSVLIHAAILLGLDAGLIARVFGVEPERVRRGLAPAVQDRGWSDVADAVVSSLSVALGVTTVDVDRPKPSADRLEPYCRSGRWAPVVDGGIG